MLSRKKTGKSMGDLKYQGAIVVYLGFIQPCWRKNTDTGMCQ